MFEIEANETKQTSANELILLDQRTKLILWGSVCLEGFSLYRSSLNPRVASTEKHMQQGHCSHWHYFSGKTIQKLKQTMKQLQTSTYKYHGNVQLMTYHGNIIICVALLFWILHDITPNLHSRGVGQTLLVGNVPLHISGLEHHWTTYSP